MIVTGGCATWLGNYSYGISIKKQPNLGYVEALSSIRIGLTYFSSILFWDGEFRLIKLFALVGLTFGILAVTNDSNQKDQRISTLWWIWGLLAGLMFALMAILSKVLSERGLNSTASIALFLGVAAIINLSISIKNSTLVFPYNRKVYIVLAVIFAAVGNYTLFWSYQIAPNLAYPIAISSTRVLLLYIVSLISRADKFDLKRGLGLAVACISTILLS
jgi:uncharacterized membrane protein